MNERQYRVPNLMKYPIRHQFSGRVLHLVEVGDREIELYAPDLRGVSLENAQLNGADLRYANLSGVCLRGARLREAMLEYADLSGADLTYATCGSPFGKCKSRWDDTLPGRDH